MKEFRLSDKYKTIDDAPANFRALTWTQFLNDNKHLSEEELHREWNRLFKGIEGGIMAEKKKSVEEKVEVKSKEIHNLKDKELRMAGLPKKPKFGGK